MSIFSYVFDSELRQRGDIESTKARLNSVVSSSRLSAERGRRLRNDLDELALICRSLYVYMKQTPGFDAAKFAEIVKQIDGLDGEVDGKARKVRSEKEKEDPSADAEAILVQRSSRSRRR
jgi:hypothetical protein